METFKHNGMQVDLVQGDITELETDAITNAANSSLILGAGVAGAIASKGGPKIQEECNEIGQCPVGEAVITTGGNLKADYVIHAVGPRMGSGDESRKLASAIRSALDIAEDNDLKSIALPAISTGVFGFPIDECAKIMVRELQAFGADEDRSSVERVVVCLYDGPAYQTFLTAFQNGWDKD